MLLGAIADDFTGASDLANTLVKGGMRTTQFIGTPEANEPVDCAAGIIALKTRSIASEDAIAQSLQALHWLLRQGCRQIIFKYCSTFDSTPSGNIGPVAEALGDAMGVPAAIVCPAFPATGRTLYLGHLFVHDRLLSESGLEKHPLNPMTDPDIRRWLRRQTRGEVGLVAHSVVKRGAEAVRQAVDDNAACGRRLVVVDAISDDDLLAIGASAADHRLITGGSGIALGLPANFAALGLLSGQAISVAPVAGPGCVLSGSCSSASKTQVSTYLENHPGFHVEPGLLIDGALQAPNVADWAIERINAEPIVYSTADPEEVAAAEARYGRDVVAQTIEDFFAELAWTLVDKGVRRLVIGGGETSGAVVSALAVDRLAVGREIDPGVPALGAERGGTLGLALKSGNFGAADLFSRALRILEVG
jgi:3-dehydrotetronate 4-kinase